MARAKGSASDFLAFIDAQNNTIAAREAEEAAAKSYRSDGSGVGVDRLQLDKMDERRAAAAEEGRRIGAKPRLRGRANTGRVVRGSMENPGPT